MTDRIVCAANRLVTGELLLGIRHWDSFMRKAADQYRHEYLVRNEEQGFVNQRGEFLDRIEAWKVAYAAGQVQRRVGGDTADGGTLYSENLY